MYQLTEMPKSTLNLFLSVATCTVITSLLFTDETPNVCMHHGGDLLFLSVRCGMNSMIEL